MEAERIESLWETLVLPNILEQYRTVTLSPGMVSELGCDNKWQAVIKATVKQLQTVEDGIFALSHYFDIPEEYDPEQITSDRLEYIASLKNVFRESGESDEDLFERFIDFCKRRDAGTPPNVIRSAKKMSGDNFLTYHEEVDAVFFVYTPHGRQLLRSQVRRLAPAGVLGLPGAALKTASAFLVIANGNKLLTVARDAARGI